MLSVPRFGAVVLTACLLLATSACGGDAEQTDAAATASETQPSAAAEDTTDAAGTTSDAPLEIADPWVKAKDSGMTGAFATITNTTDEALTIVDVESPASEYAELHETVMDESGSTVMRAKEGGFEIPAGGELVLAPGEDHLMLMNLTGPLAPGDNVEFSIHLSDDTTQTFTADVKEFVGAQENYQHTNESKGEPGHGEGMGHGDGTGQDASAEGTESGNN